MVINWSFILIMALFSVTIILTIVGCFWLEAFKKRKKEERWEKEREEREKRWEEGRRNDVRWF